jgi:hypothetical protein
MVCCNPACPAACSSAMCSTRPKKASAGIIAISVPRSLQLAPVTLGKVKTHLLCVKIAIKSRC